MFKSFISTRVLGPGPGAKGSKVGFININDMYINDVGKGGERVYEAYEVK
jgi:hypothetical protein